MTAQEEIGLRLMMALAEAAAKDEGEVRIGTLARDERLGVANTAKVLNLLSRAGLVKGMRGVNGGYVLSRPPEEITLYEVLSALTESSTTTSRVPILEAGRLINCPRFPECSLKVVWMAIEKALKEVLEKVSLKDMAEGRMEELGSRLGLELEEGEPSGKILTTTIRQQKGREEI